MKIINTVLDIYLLLLIKSTNLDGNKSNSNRNSNIQIIDVEKNEDDLIHNNYNIIIEKENDQNNLKFELSDCWETISKNRYNKNFDIQREFLKKIVNKEEFFKDPWKIINNPNLAIKAIKF